MTGTASLLLVLKIVVGGPGRCLTITDLGCTNVDGNLVFAPNPFDGKLHSMAVKRVGDKISFYYDDKKVNEQEIDRHVNLYLWFDALGSAPKIKSIRLTAERFSDLLTTEFRSAAPTEFIFQGSGVREKPEHGVACRYRIPALAVSREGTILVPGVLQGLERLRVPAPIIGITGFMLRYIDVVLGQFGRMRRAMESCAYRPRSIRSSAPLAAATGALFVRSFERGERVFLAMSSRGYTGSLPGTEAVAAPRSAWVAAAVLLGATWAIAAAAWLVR